MLMINGEVFLKPVGSNDAVKSITATQTKIEKLKDLMIKTQTKIEKSYKNNKASSRGFIFTLLIKEGW